MPLGIQDMMNLVSVNAMTAHGEARVAVICICESGFGELGGTHADINFWGEVAQLLRPWGGPAMLMGKRQACP